MSGSKRKRHDEESHPSPRKKLALDNPAQVIRTSIVRDNDDQWAPVLASMPGLSLPNDIDFKPYSKAPSGDPGSSLRKEELLLYSSAHPELDYVASEECSNGSDNYIKHYVGVYDPHKGTLNLVRARTAVVRSTLRSARRATGNNGTDEMKGATKDYLTARTDLGLTFGTKKSQKAIRALTANAIQASPSKKKTQDSSLMGSQLDPLASAVVSSMAETTSFMRTREEMQLEIDEQKPRPKPNMSASRPADVYPLEQLVGGTNILAAMAVKDWIDKTNEGKDIQLKSLFIARKLKAVVQSGDVKKLKTMRYLLLLIEWTRSLSSHRRIGKKVPKLEEMGSLVEAFGRDIVSVIAKRFSDASQLNKWHLDNLTTHILALALTVDEFTIDMHDICEDLRLDSVAVSKYYAELGCVVSSPTKPEQAALRITKSEASGHRIARLLIPLSFPKMRVPMSKKKGR